MHNDDSHLLKIALYIGLIVFVQAHGFEMLCSRCASPSSTDTATPHQDEGSIDVTSGVRWQRYVESLKKKGYFRVSAQWIWWHTVELSILLNGKWMTQVLPFNIT